MDRPRLFSMLIVLQFSVRLDGASLEKVCNGTDSGLSHSGSAAARYEEARRKYLNCTFVDGNLELKYLDEDQYDLTFLEHIREITGYLLINAVHADDIPLSSLRIVRGRKLFDYGRHAYSVYIARNFKKGTGNVGVKALLLTDLHEVSNGEVYIGKNLDLCYVNTILWKDIVLAHNASITIEDNNDHCPGCHESCNNSYDGLAHCWNDGNDSCQELHRLICSCQGYCHGQNHGDCCDDQCAGGCSGPTSHDCWACVNYQAAEVDGGNCVEFCPPMYTYDNNELKTLLNPKVRYVFDTRCVLSCPSHLLVNRRSCVKSCDEDQRPVDGVCQRCDGPCPKRCEIGHEHSGLNGHHNHIMGIAKFKGCTILEGDLEISDSAFEGDLYYGLPGINVSDLAILNNVREITGHLRIQTDHLTNLNFLSNLQAIGGMSLFSSSVSSLGLISLIEIKNGNVNIAGNTNLCYVSSINFTLLLNGDQSALISGNRNQSECVIEGAVCDDQCSDDGCWGPGPRQCLKCANYILSGECVPSCKRPLVYDAGNATCRMCHQECNNSCNGSKPNECDACKHVKDGSDCSAKCPEGKMSEEGQCVGKCNEKFYSMNNACLPCDENCNGCVDATSSDCKQCSEKAIALPEDDELEDISEHTKKRCVSTCPEDRPYIGHGEKQFFAMCLRTNPNKTKYQIIGLAAGAVILLVGTALIFLFCRRQQIRAEENVAKLTARITGTQELEPLNESGAEPDMSELRLIKVSELRKGKVIGAGAFGTVFSGVWIPEGEDLKIPVAIKELLSNSASSSATKELLAEARVMASVRHSCCIRIIALCIADLPLLITQLMPLGCLLEYIRQYQANIGSKVFLNWSTQIAKGMEYLEKKAIVHRDLAARNVLVQSPEQVKITDFGLSKLLNTNQDMYQARGGKMPVKWLALESIRYQVYTSKSDVWSYGVTLWEMFTYGGKPYENVSARDVVRLLEKGERLPQPSICTIDIFMVMVSCWLVDADSRPSFAELVREVRTMARDPTRYLVIPGDVQLRLPSQDRTNQRMILQQMSVIARHPGAMMEAEDYLQPQQEELSSSPESPGWHDAEQPSFEPRITSINKKKISSPTTNDDVSGLPAIKKQLSRQRSDSIDGRYTEGPRCAQRLRRNGSHNMSGHGVSQPLNSISGCLAEEAPEASGPYINSPCVADPIIIPTSNGRDSRFGSGSAGARRLTSTASWHANGLSESENGDDRDGDSACVDLISLSSGGHRPMSVNGCRWSAHQTEVDFLRPVGEDSDVEQAVEGYLDMSGDVSPTTFKTFLSFHPKKPAEATNKIGIGDTLEINDNYINQQSEASTGDGQYVNQVDSAIGGKLNEDYDEIVPECPPNWVCFEE